jgi:hypothetical protein
MVRRLARWPVAIVGVALIGAITVFAMTRERSPQPSVEAFCREMGAAQDLDESLAGFDPDLVDPDVTALRRAAGVAPPEIAAHVDAVLTLAAELEITLASARTDQAGALQATLRDRTAELAAVGEAGRAVEDYTRVNCGLELR